jgi:hypothetical protein
MTPTGITYLKRGGLVGLCVGVLLLSIGIVQLGLQSLSGPEPARPAITYDALAICTDAVEQEAHGDNDHHAEAVDYVDIKLRDGCFSGFVRLPDGWQSWRVGFVSSEPDRHVGYWYFGWEKSKGPYGPNGHEEDDPAFEHPPHGPYDPWHVAFRLQGTGTLRFIETSGTGFVAGHPAQSAPPPKSADTDTPPKPAEPAEQAHESTKVGTTEQLNQVDFTFKACVLSADTVSCTFNVTNRGQQQQTCISGSSRMIDSDGAEYRIKFVRLGNARDEASYTGAFNVLVPGVPLAAELSFERVPSSMTVIPLVDIKTCHGEVQFFDVPVIKDEDIERTGTR